MKQLFLFSFKYNYQSRAIIRFQRRVWPGSSTNRVIKRPAARSQRPPLARFVARSLAKCMLECIHHHTYIITVTRTNLHIKPCQFEFLRATKYNQHTHKTGDGTEFMQTRVLMWGALEPACSNMKQPWECCTLSALYIWQHYSTPLNRTCILNLTISRRLIYIISWPGDTC